MKPNFKTRASALLALLPALAMTLSARAQSYTLLFSVTDPGVTRSITNWGLDTCWANSDNMQRGLIYMGTNNVNIVRVGFTVDSPLTNNDVTPADKTVLQTDINLAAMATAATKWDLNLDSTVNSWYNSAVNTVYPDRWAAAMEACQRYYNKKFWSAEGFNEPDYTENGEGSGQNLEAIFGYLQASTNFVGTALEGGSTLDDDNAVTWFDPTAASASIGSTHCLAGTAANYVTFMQTVLSSNAAPFNPELHNVMEAIMGANYGLYGGIWWGTAELARGSFVNACRGKQLAYADDQPNWTAAAVYRGTNGAVQAFAGGSERMAVTTSYRLFSRDRDVFYDGHGPQRAYTVTVLGGNGYQVNQPDMEKLVNITWGSDVQPPVSGRYILVNRNSGQALEVPGASTNNGVFLEQTTYTGASNQLWDVYPIPVSFGGDLDYYTMTAAFDGVTADNYNWSYASGNPIDQWNGGTNDLEQWFFQYAGNGYFNICNRWSGQYLDVYGSSVNTGASIVQSSASGRTSQQWRLIPVGNPVEFVIPATPTGVTATAGAVSVKLSWNTNTAANLAGYNVLRATNSGGPFNLVARGLTNNAYTDPEANQPQTYYYVIQSADRSLNTSANSATVSVTPTGAPALLALCHLDDSVSDSSGNSNNAVLAGPANYGPGVAGESLKMDGVTNTLELPAGLLDYANFTVATWVYWNGGAAWQRIFDFGNNTTQYMFLTPDSGSGTLRFAITTNGPGAEQRIEIPTPMASNQWVHVAVTESGGTVSLYTNGILAATTTGITLNPAMFDPALNYFGLSQFSGDPLLSGWLDEVYAANYAMTAGQIAALAVNPAPLPALVHRYSFNETAGTTVHDSVGGAAWNGTLPNGGTFANGQLALTAANSQYVSLPGGMLSNYSAVTIEAWVTFPDQIAWNTMFFSFGRTNGAEGNNYIFCSPQGGRIAITSTDYTGEQNAYSDIDFSYHTNFHVTAVFNPPAGSLLLYTNGVLAGVNDAVTVPLNEVSNIFSYIGRSLYSGDTYIDFSMDEFRIYNGALQPADIATAQFLGPNTLLATNATLAATTSPGNLTLAWPAASSGFTLESSPTLGTGAVWTPVSIPPSLIGSNNQVAVNPTNATLFFRLQR